MSSIKWQKVLYLDQGVPDNYVDETFLDEFKKNVHIRTYEYWKVVEETGVVMQQLSSICLFVVAFIAMKAEMVAPSSLIVIGGCLSVIGFFVFDWLDGGNGRELRDRTRLDDVRSFIIFVAFTFGMSPVLGTLTDTISTDTIYAMTVFMLLANLFFHDYGTSKVVVSKSLSLNASVFASVCLASRLPTTLHAFATVTLALQLFALWPELRKKFKVHLPQSQHLITWCNVLVSICCLLWVDMMSGAAGLSLVHLIVTYIVPLLLVNLQPYKNNIYGPWDEAVIQH